MLPGSMKEPLVSKGETTVVKSKLWFGYLPLWQETVPLHPNGKIDTVRLIANIMAGLIIGIRQTLSAIVSATLVFTTTSNQTVVDMFPFGISMMWWSTVAGTVWYGIFGRLQYNTSATQEVCAILYGAMAGKAATFLEDTPDKIPPTVLALIVTGTILTGFGTVAFGKLGIGKMMLSFPTPVTNGFLGTIGFFLVKQALQITSGVKFVHFYPISFSAFFAMRSVLPLLCLFAMVMVMRKGPRLLGSAFPKSKAVKKLGGLFCQLSPLFVFYIVIGIGRMDLDTLGEAGWVYPAQAPQSFTTLWTTYKLSDADWGVVAACVPDFGSLVLMSALCTMTGVLGITGKFPTGPDGDPAPDEGADFDMELATVGVGAVFTGLTNGVVTFHRLGSSIQIRMDGGTHRIAVFSSAAFVGVFFFSGIPLGHYIPKFFLGGLFMSSGVSFMESVIFSYQSMASSGLTLFGSDVPTWEYFGSLLCIATAAYTSPLGGIAAGLLVSVLSFLASSSSSTPVSSVSDGRFTMGRTFRPIWELKALRTYGDRIAILYLQGQLFFGSGQRLASLIAEAVESRHHLSYCILSFAKVSGMDVSAVDFLRSVQRKVARKGCKLIFCRMEKEVFSALSAAKLINSPSKELRDVIAGTVEPPRAMSIPNAIPEDEEFVDQEDVHDIGLGHRKTQILMLRKDVTFEPLEPFGQGNDDAFDHETDALDFCAEKVVKDVVYFQGAKLDPQLLQFRAACETGTRITESTFESLNSLPKGLMAEIKPSCKVFDQYAPNTARGWTTARAAANAPRRRPDV